MRQRLVYVLIGVVCVLFVVVVVVLFGLRDANMDNGKLRQKEARLTARLNETKAELSDAKSKLQFEELMYEWSLLRQVIEQETRDTASIEMLGLLQSARLTPFSEANNEVSSLRSGGGRADEIRKKLLQITPLPGLAVLHRNLLEAAREEKKVCEDRAHVGEVTKSPASVDTKLVDDAIQKMLAEAEFFVAEHHLSPERYSLTKPNRTYTLD